MCGIMGYVGHRVAAPLLVDGLKALEYRGYDSAGIALLDEKGHHFIAKKPGKVANLLGALHGELVDHAQVGIGHTRWATHGGISEKNAHPHVTGHFIFLHNGIIENFQELREELQSQGHVFKSETDSEVFGHLLQECERATAGDVLKAARMAFRRLHGSSTIVMMDDRHARQIIALKNGTPLVVGVGNKEAFIASDTQAISEYTNKIHYLENGEMVLIENGKVSIMDLDGKDCSRAPDEMSFDHEKATLGPYRYFMEKEIYEQDTALINTINTYVDKSRGEIEMRELEIIKPRLSRVDRVHMVACGTAWHAGFICKYFWEHHLRIPVELDLASEYRYRQPIISENTLFVCVSQSGETADTLAALRFAKDAGALTLSICNVRGSSIAREAHATLFTNAGPEIGVASTKAFTTQVCLGLLLGYKLSHLIARPMATHFLEQMVKVPQLVSQTFSLKTDIDTMMKGNIDQYKTFLFLGRGAEFPIALEGALKLKEISYLHAEGYAAGELKHGPIALVDSSTVCVAIATKDRHYEKVVSNIMEVKARGGKIFAIGTVGDEKLKSISDWFVGVAPLDEYLQTLLTIIPLQIFAFELAVKLGRDVDKPRNLAKSVTVE